MVDVNMAALYQACQPRAEVDAIAMTTQPMHAALFEPLVTTAPSARLDEPSSLTLALIGVATLAAYRGIQRRVVERVTGASADRGLIKPRRRAA